MEETVYIAVSRAVYEEEFRSRSVHQLVAHFNVHLLVVDVQIEEVVTWIK